MSLGDRYNRGDGRLANLDRYLTHLGERAARAWLDRTGTGSGTLVQGLYFLSAWAAVQHLTFFRNPTVVIFAGAALLALQGLTRSRGGLVEQIQSEAMGLPKWWFAGCRLFVLVLGLFNLAIAAGGILAAFLAGAAVLPETAGALLLGCTMAALQAGDYIGRANPLPPSRGLRQGG